MALAPAPASVPLGSQGLKVARLGFGCMSLTPFSPAFASAADLSEEQVRG